MKTKELINKTFDRVIKKIKKQQLTEQVVPPQIVEQTDKNITEMYKNERLEN